MIKTYKTFATWFKVLIFCFALVFLSTSIWGDWRIQTVYAVGDVGQYNDIAIDTNNRPHICFYDATYGDLMYARWTGSSWAIETVDGLNVSVGKYASIALDSSNNPAISYYDETNGNLKYAKKSGTSWNISTVDSTGNVGKWTSIALGTNNFPHISYYDATNRKLKYARWTGISWSIEVVDSSYRTGEYSSLALDTNNKPHISYQYFDGHFSNLRYAKKPQTAWIIDTVVDYKDIEFYNALALDSNNLPHISYLYPSLIDDYGLVYAKGTGTMWDSEYIGRISSLAECFNSIAIGSFNLPRIAYFEETSVLKYAQKNLTPWGPEWSLSTVDTLNYCWGENCCSLALDSNEYAHISYYDKPNGNLKYARWNPNPSLEWTGEPNYTADGLHPENGLPNSTTFTYRVKYKDTEGDPPKSGYPKVHILKGGIEIPGSPFTMSFVSGDYQTGAIYTYSRTLTPGTDYTYYFEAYDQYDAPASGSPTNPIDAPDVQNSAPTLSWSGEPNYETDGLHPEQGVVTETIFTYKIKYTDQDNDPPKAGYPKVHIKKGGVEIPWSPFIMFYESGAYNTGAIYYCQNVFMETGDDYTYSFEARDKWDYVSNELSGSGPIVTTPSPTPTLTPTPTPTPPPTLTPTPPPTPTPAPVAHFTFDSGAEGWQFAGTIPPFTQPATTIAGGVLGLSPAGSNNSFSYWYSPPIQLLADSKNSTIYRSTWSIGSTATEPNKTVQFRLRVNQQGAWSAWDRVVNSYLSIAPLLNISKNYTVFFEPSITGTNNDNTALFSFDILSFDITDDMNSWIFIDELMVDKVSYTTDTAIASYDFQSSSEGWTFGGSIAPFDQPTSIVTPGRLGLNPNGSINCFSYWLSPDIVAQDNKIYRIRWEVESTTSNPDDAVQFRLRINQRGTWSAWNRIVNSYLHNAPAWGNPLSYDLFINPIVSGTADDNHIILSFDIMSFDPNDDIFSWNLLNSVSIEEVVLNP